VRREERVLVLVWSLPDALPAPSSWTGSLTRGQPRRAAGDDPYVVGTGAGVEVRAEPVVHVEGCEWCQEAPRARWDEGRGTWMPLSARYDRLPRGTGVWKGQRCVPCDGSGWRPVTPAVNGERRGTRELIAYRLPGSYAELEAALGELRDVSPRAFKRLLAVVFMEEPIGDWSALAIRFVSERLPVRITLAPGVIDSWRAREERRWLLVGPRRDEQIRKLAREGESLTRIAVRAHLTERHVRRIVRGR